MDLSAVKDWIGGHKWEAGGIGAGVLGGGALLLHKAKAGKPATGQPARLVVGRASAARVQLALREIEAHTHRQPHRKPRKRK